MAKNYTPLKTKAGSMNMVFVAIALVALLVLGVTGFMLYKSKTESQTVFPEINPIQNTSDTSSTPPVTPPAESTPESSGSAMPTTIVTPTRAQPVSTQSATVAPTQ